MKHELLDGWEWKTLGNIGEICSGGTPSTREETYFNGDIPWITPADLSNFEDIYIEGGKRNISEKGLKNSSAKLLPKDSIIFSTRAPIGYVAITSNPLATNQGFKNIILNDGLFPKYVYYYLKSNTKLMRKYASGTTFLEVSAKRFSQVPIIIPPLEIQHKIVAILEKAEETKKLRAQADKLTQHLLQSVFLEMFGDPITNPMNLTKMKLGNLCKIRRGASPRPIKNYVGGTVPWIKIGDGTKGSDIYIEKTAEKIIIEGVDKSVLLKKGSLIFANCGVSLGFARILKIDGCIHDGWLSLEDISTELNKIYLLKLINSISNYFRLTAPDGTQPNLNITIMKNFEISVPPISMQNKFAEVVDKIERSKKYQHQSSQEIDNLFNALMQKAFTGDLIH